MNESDPLVLSEIAEAIPVLSIAQTRREREGGTFESERKREDPLLISNFCGVIAHRNDRNS